MCTILNCTFKDNFIKFGLNLFKIELEKVICVEFKKINFVISVL